MQARPEFFYNAEVEQAEGYTRAAALKRGGTMYVYKRTEPGMWTVGYYDPDGRWEPESDHNSTDKAAARVAYLNGAGAVAATLDQALNSGDGTYRP